MRPKPFLRISYCMPSVRGSGHGRIWVALAAALLTFTLNSRAQLPPLQPPEKEASKPQKVDTPQVGEIAPDFSLPDKFGSPVTLSELLRPKGEEDGAKKPWVLLVFYRGYWCPFCNADLRSLQEHLDEFTARGVRIVAVSSDAPDVTRKHTQKQGYTFTFLSDPRTETIRRYHLLRAGQGLRRADVARPAQFLIDSTGTIRWAKSMEDHRVSAQPADVLAFIDAFEAAE